MKWYRRNWYWVGGFVAAAALIYLAAAWGISTCVSACCLPVSR